MRVLPNYKFQVLLWFGAVDWSCDPECVDRRFDSQVETFNLQLGSTPMVSINTPCQPLSN